MTEGLPGGPRFPAPRSPALCRAQTDPFPLNDVWARTELLHCLNPPREPPPRHGTDSSRVDLQALAVMVAAAVAIIVVRASSMPPSSSPQRPIAPFRHRSKSWNEGEGEGPVDESRPTSPTLCVVDPRRASPIESFNPEATKYRLQINDLMGHAMEALSRGDVRTFQCNKARVAELHRCLAEAEGCSPCSPPRTPVSWDESSRHWAAEDEPQALAAAEDGAREGASSREPVDPALLALHQSAQDMDKALEALAGLVDEVGSEDEASLEEGSSRVELRPESPSPLPTVADIALVAPPAKPENSTDTSSCSPSSPRKALGGVSISIPDCVICYSQQAVVVNYGVLSSHHGRTTKVYRRYNEFRTIHDHLQGVRFAKYMLLLRPFPSFPGSRVFGSTNRSKGSIDRRRQDLEAFLRRLVDPASSLLDNSELSNFLLSPARPVAVEGERVIKSVWRLVPDQKLNDSGTLRLCIWPFEPQLYAGDDVLVVHESTPISREEAGMRYRVLANFHKWVAETFREDALPTERHYQLFLYSSLAFVGPLHFMRHSVEGSSRGNCYHGYGPPRPAAQHTTRPAKTKPASNSRHRVAHVAEMCEHTLVRVVCNARRHNTGVALPFTWECVHCGERPEPPEGGSLCSSPPCAGSDSSCAPSDLYCNEPSQASNIHCSKLVTTHCHGNEGPEDDLDEFPKCLCSDLMLCQVPGRAAWYESPLCDMTILVTPPPLRPTPQK